LQKSMNSLNRREAISLLRSEGCDSGVIEHSIAVSKLAKKIANKITKKGNDIDINFVEIAALLHDIGRCKTHGIKHGIEGARILRKLGHDKFARVCEVHLGAGITRSEAISLGLPPKDYIPKTLEEKIIAHADNLIAHTRVVPIDDTINKLKQKLGNDHPAIKRVRELNNFIESLSK